MSCHFKYVDITNGVRSITLTFDESLFGSSVTRNELMKAQLRHSSVVVKKNIPAFDLLPHATPRTPEFVSSGSQQSLWLRDRQENSVSFRTIRFWIVLFTQILNGCYLATAVCWHGVASAPPAHFFVLSYFSVFLGIYYIMFSEILKMFSSRTRTPCTGPALPAPG